MAIGKEFGASKQFQNSRGRGQSLGSTRANNSAQKYGLPTKATKEPSNQDQRFDDVKDLDELEARFNFSRYEEGPEQLGWMLNMHETLIKDDEWPSGRAGVDFYFLNDNGETFKTTQAYSPYMFIGCKTGTEGEVEEFLRRRFENAIESMKRVKKEDLDQPNHLVGNTRTLIQLFFRNMNDLYAVRRVLLPAVKNNQAKISAIDTYAEVVSEANHVHYEPEYSSASKSSRKNPNEALENIIDIREYDVPYYVRVAIDLDIRVGLWYTATAKDDGSVSLTLRPEIVHRPEPVVLAFDIETTKLPLKFPDAAYDSIMMISYMIDGRGYLITNRQIVSQDIEDFEYTPKPEFEGPFTIFNEDDECALLNRFYEHIQTAQPNIYVTYNGDFFDWPFMEARSKANGIDMYKEIGVYKDEEDEYKCKHASHMDAFRWVKRDSYLPQGSQGLKAVTTVKLGYNPMELDPEDMTRFASEQPQTLAQYSVSDAVATYYLYMKYVHPFIFSLCNIIPLVPDEVLRKGTGTLCELLLMVEAFKVNVIMPNKHMEANNQFFEGHLLESETYVGGHVEALEAGVFRSDLPTDFKIEPQAAQQLIDQLDDALKFTIRVEEKKDLNDIENYDQVRNEIKRQLEDLRDKPLRHEPPLIYHLDVAAMYPNIILTNRLQPDAMVEESTCATCEFNRPNKTCDRRMTWSWRGEYFPAKQSEYRMVQHQLSIETFPPKYPNGPKRLWHTLTEAEQATLLNKRLSDYCRKVYGKVHETKTIERESIICQRENPFYIETVRAFRDRRYEYKGLHKTWKQNMDKAVGQGQVTQMAEAKNMIVLYDSLQLAHKVILNSFYGYVMRKGARWHSLSMAGIVCLTGAKIIQMARQLVERIGRPLELDTDGIWCILPKSFPESFSFKLKNGKKFNIDYPCTMLNHLVHAKFTNDQYQDLVSPETFEYKTHSENSIFFEIDGPYRAMILPSSTAEDKLLKKRYAVFNANGSLAELKGFEVKRRGELKLIKIFQSQIFKVFLEGTTLEECYKAVAKVADQWLDVLISEGKELKDEELFELISENRSMSKTLEEYGSQKSTSITTARRLAEFLGNEMVKDKGLACKFIISKKPLHLPVSERAVPVVIFNAEPSTRKHFLRKWLKDNSLVDFDIRGILDWEYYKERFGSVIQKLITIPAAMQKVNNPVPRIRHPDWLFKRVAAKDDKFKQHRITEMFTVTDTPMAEPNAESSDLEMEDVETGDIEELDVPKMNNSANSLVSRHVPKVTKYKRPALDPALPEEDLQRNMPNMYEDYSAWLEFQKRKWKRQRLIRQKNKEMHGQISTGDRSNVGGYFRRQTGSLVSSVWEIVQIVETDLPGEFKMWIFAQQQMHCVKLSIPRTFYLNSREEEPTEVFRQNPSCDMTRCVRTLPRSRPCLNLFRITMSEAKFQEEQKKFSSIFNDPSTEGVYETQMPLGVRALLELGTLCEVDKKKAGRRSLEDYFALDDLISRTDPRSQYISQPKEFNYIYLYHVNTDNRHFLILIGASLPQARVFLVGSTQLSQQMPNIKRIYNDAYERKFGMIDTHNTIVPMKKDMEFEVTFHKSEREVFKGINKTLGKYQDLKRGPTVLVISSPRPASYFTQQTRTMNEFPYMTLQSLQQDSRFDALNWIQPVIKRTFEHYFNLSSSISKRLSQARYSSVPFCNIPEDANLFMADIAMARRMVKNDMILWWSTSTKPDLGGREDDENLLATEEPINPEINNPGLYQDICVEIDISRLCLDTILEAPCINELEGTSGATAFDSVAHSLDEYSNGTVSIASAFGDGSISQKTFVMLRSTVQTWFHQAAAQGIGLAETMTETLHRWLLSPTSGMYDPCMYALVHGMMKKVFMQLVAEFKRLGAAVVFGNFHKIVIATSKETMDSAIPYCEYILRSIEKKQVFEVIGLNIVEYWDILVWMDETNYGCVNASSEDGTKITSIWNIQSYLPPAVQGMFRNLCASFVHQELMSKKKFPRGLSGHLGTPGDTTQTNPRTQHMQEYISSDVMRGSLRWLPQFLHRQEANTVGEDEDLKFPQLPGSHLNMTNPALEYIKFICAVFNLDKSLEKQVRTFKRNALRTMGGMSDFSNEAQFRNPCEYIKVYRVVCTNCNYTADLDFCRDENLMPVNGQVQPWRCRNCHFEYDKHQVEEVMIEQVQRWLTSFQLQDLKCGRCRSVKRENLLQQCDKCGSEYLPTQSKTDLMRRLRVFGNVAREQQLRLLGEIIQWSLARI
ncbi:hypothetical protein CLU79DRAFT_216823 [Phycomyces nitens]|nr:hypothetical protein CLU79DRAFT_216823 [Phycomyces nitens]